MGGGAGGQAALAVRQVTKACNTKAVTAVHWELSLAGTCGGVSGIYVSALWKA